MISLILSEKILDDRRTYSIKIRNFSHSLFLGVISNPRRFILGRCAYSRLVSEIQTNIQNQFVSLRNKYTLEGVRTSCSVRWQDRSFNVVSYNILMFIFAYIIPLAVMIYCNIKIYLEVKWKDHILFCIHELILMSGSWCI